MPVWSVPPLPPLPWEGGAGPVTDTFGDEGLWGGDDRRRRGANESFGIRRTRSYFSTGQKLLVFYSTLSFYIFKTVIKSFTLIYSVLMDKI